MKLVTLLVDARREICEKLSSSSPMRMKKGQELRLFVDGLCEASKGEGGIYKGLHEEGPRFVASAEGWWAFRDHIETPAERARKGSVVC
jgi:hypothetical protein